MSTAELLLENRSMGWVSATTAPAWAQARILEVRRAQIENRPTPPLSRTYIAEAEQRSASVRSFINRLFPNRKSLEDRFVESHGYDPWLTRSIANRQALEIRRDAPLLVRIRAASKPVYLMSADEIYHRQMAREYEKRAVSLEVKSCRCSTSEEHRKAADAHSSRARKTTTSVEEATAHYIAAERHQKAASLPSDSSFSDARDACIRASNWVTP